MSLAVIGSLVFVALVVGASLRSRRRRRLESRELASTLVPEIRELMRRCDPSGPGRGDPGEPSRDASLSERAARGLPPDALHAVRNFYACVDEYREARRAMTEAFAEGSELSLGDRIRAKDGRDRSLKDVYYTGEAAAQILERL